MPPRTTTLRQLLERYDAFLLDAYGVLVDSSRALPGALELLTDLDRRGRPWAVVTNDASRLPETAAARYRSFGLPVPSERVVTSAGLLRAFYRAHDLAGAATLVLGPADSVRAVEQAGGRVLPLEGDETPAVVVVADERGYPFLEGVDALLSRLFRAFDAGREPLLLLPNPDLVFPRGDGGYGITAGAVALVLEAALALRYPARRPRFTRLGKPDPAIVEAALERLGTRDAVMIGDQLATDVAAAAAAGIDSALLTTGLSGPEAAAGGGGDEAAGPRPTWLLEALDLD